jgi:hypothetical protein
MCDGTLRAPSFEPRDWERSVRVASADPVRLGLFMVRLGNKSAAAAVGATFGNQLCPSQFLQ